MHHSKPAMKPLLAALLASLLCVTAVHAFTPPKEQPPRRALPAPTTLVTLDWDDLLPDDELTLEFEDLIADHDYLSEEGAAAQQTGSSKVRAGMNNRLVRVPGFIVPLSMNAQGVITEAFLVPYYGACIHVPPPPPNQIVYLHSEKGFRVRSIYDPYWVTGTMRTQVKATRLGSAAYTLQATKVELYE